MRTEGKMNVKQAGRCSMNFLDFTKPDAKDRIFVEFTCHITCEFKTMCLKIRSVIENRLNGGLK